MLAYRVKKKSNWAMTMNDPSRPSTSQHMCSCVYRNWICTDTEIFQLHQPLYFFKPILLAFQFTSHSVPEFYYFIIPDQQLLVSQFSFIFASYWIIESTQYCQISTSLLFLLMIWVSSSSVTKEYRIFCTGFLWQHVLPSKWLATPGSSFTPPHPQR